MATSSDLASPLLRALAANGTEFDLWPDALSAPARLDTVRELGLLDTEPEPEYDRLTRIARRMLGGSIALLSIIDDKRQFNKSVDGIEGLREMPIEGSFCRHVVAKQSPIMVPNAQAHAVLKSMLGTNPLGVESYAGVPLIVDGTHAIGVLCVLGNRPQQFTAEDLQALEDLAKIAADELSLRKANEGIDAQRRLLAAVVDGIQEAVIVLDTEGRVLLRNHAYYELVGVGLQNGEKVDTASIARRGFFDATGSAGLTYEESPLGRVFAGEDIVRMDVVHRQPTRSDRYLHVNATSLRKPDGRIGAGIAVLHDITEERRTQRAHEEREVLLDVVLANLPDTGVFVFDRNLEFLIASGDPIMHHIGLSKDAVGKHLSRVVSPKHVPGLQASFEATLAGTHVQASVERGGRTLAARTIPLQDKSGEVFAGIALLSDVTERVQAERRLEAQAQELKELSLTDELTGLHNRRGFVTLATQELKLAARYQRHAAVLYIDVDDLKPVNDGLGHEEGDRLLRDVAKVLRSSFRESDVVARLGGDEFAVLTVEIVPQNIETLEARIAQGERTFNECSERPYRLSLSLGTELYDPRSGDTLDALLARADERMYTRKQARKRERETPAR